MVKFLYKTRGDAIPKGKARVYFCCHPEDFNKYFTEIADDILKKQNCAVWYLESYDTEYDESFFEDLKQMQLFVMPVTSKLLNEQNHALEEFEYAIKHHIPVLPLMQEAGLEMLFNQKCGELQFLAKHIEDATAISYDKKLELYLQSVLIGDELSDKIRSAFDAYVFLSYRKKDRKHAQELMRLIHKNDFCRDIAVWYDEFLRPGEDFNASIEAALKKSELFVLAVTPNLVEEQNYIITTEYPMAMEAKKPVFPVEMVETDKESLGKCFANIPNCVNAYDEKALSEALSAYAKHIAFREDTGTPEHKFFIGMAYLGGVDVEVDSERAVALITEAAEAGVEEAQRQLVVMYRSGMGVERSFETSVEWHEKQVQTLYNAYMSGRCEERLRRYLDELLLLKDEYLSLGKLDDIGGVLAKMHIFATESNISDKVSLALYRAAYHAGYGERENAKALYKFAAEEYGKAIEKLEELQEADRTEEVRIKHCEYIMRQGEAYSQIGAWEGALGLMQSELNVLEKFDEEEPVTYFRILKARLAGSLGQRFYEIGRRDTALEIFDKALRATNVLYEETKGTDILCDLFELHLGSGIAMDDSRECDKEQSFKKSLEILDELEKRLPAMRVTEYKIRVLSELAVVRKRQLKREEATALYQQLLPLCEEVAKGKSTSKIKKVQAEILLSLGDLYLENGVVEQARKCFNEAEHMINLLYCNTDQGIDIMEKLALAQEKQGTIYEITGDYENADERFMRSLVFRTMASDEGPTMENLAALKWCYIKLADVEDDPESVLILCEKAIPKVEKYCIAASGKMGSSDEGYGILHAEGFLRMCRILVEAGLAQKAMDSVLIAKEVAGKNDYRKNLTDCLRFLRALNLLGDTYAGVGETKNAESQYKKILTIIEESVPYFAFSPEVRFEQAQALYKLCGEKKTLFNGKKFKKVVELMQELMDNHGYHVKYVEFYNLLKNRQQI